MSVDIGDFQGARKITSLPCYPLNYHKNEAELRKTLIERGKKFVQLSGVHYKNHQGMAYFKKKKAVVKVNINGRIMVDPAIHRRINPNYPISRVRPRDNDASSGEESDGDDDSCCYETDSDDGSGGHSDGSNSEDEKPKFKVKFVKDKNGNVRAIRVPRDESDDDDAEGLDTVQTANKEGAGKVDEGKEEENKDEESAKPEKPAIPEFSDEEYLIASPVVLGFAFSEKLWLEFTVSGIKEIQWNDTAYDSLVLEPKTKDIVKVCTPAPRSPAHSSTDHHEYLHYTFPRLSLNPTNTMPLKA